MEKNLVPTPKPLYISDLDGTLLGRDAALSDYTVNALNALIDRGVGFSVASARSPATAISMLSRVKINVPVILMNGVLIYDTAAGRYVKKEMLAPEKTAKILAAMKRLNQTGLMYTLTDDELSTYYERIYSDAFKNFIDERTQKYGKKFVQTDDFADVTRDVIYFCYMDTREKIRRLRGEIEGIDGLRMEMYRDIYDGGDLWYLEVFSGDASKFNAVRFLRREYGFGKVVGFGDNLNDLPLFAACDEAYAVANAVPEAKERATAVIGSNAEDGVVKWMEKNAVNLG